MTDKTASCQNCLAPKLHTKTFFIVLAQGTVQYLKTYIFFCNLQMGPKSLIICHWQAFLALCYLTRLLIGPIRKIWREWSVANTESELKVYWDLLLEYVDDLHGGVHVGVEPLLQRLLVVVATTWRRRYKTFFFCVCHRRCGKLS